MCITDINIGIYDITLSLKVYKAIYEENDPLLNKFFILFNYIIK